MLLGEMIEHRRTEDLFLRPNIPRPPITLKAVMAEATSHDSAALASEVASRFAWRQIECHCRVVKAALSVRF